MMHNKYMDFKFQGYLLFLSKLFIIYLSSSFVSAAEVNNSIVNNNIVPQAIILGIILIITGVIFCFLGRKIYRLTLFLVGFYIGVIITWMILEPSRGFSNDGGISNNMGMGEETRLTIILIVSFVIGSLIGGIFVCCASLGIWFIGALAGYTLASFIISWSISIYSLPNSSNGTSPSNIMGGKLGQSIFIIVLTFTGFVLTCIFENMVIIFGTSFIGAYAIILGIEIFAKTDFISNNTNLASILGAILNGKAILDGNSTSYETNTLLLAGMAILFILGSLYQYNYNVGTFYPNGLNHTPKPSYSQYLKNRKISSWDNKNINIV